MAASSLATSCRYLGSSQPLNESNAGQRILCNLVFCTDLLEGAHLIVRRFAWPADAVFQQELKEGRLFAPAS
jgi:hypothetical protein